MNSRLEKLFENYHFSDKDRYEFLQIYDLLSAHKKVKALENFNHIYENMQLLREDLRQQHEILFGKALKNIENKVSQIKKKSVLVQTKSEIESLKSLI